MQLLALNHKFALHDRSHWPKKKFTTFISFLSIGKQSLDELQVVLGRPQSWKTARSIGSYVPFKSNCSFSQYPSHLCHKPCTSVSLKIRMLWVWSTGAFNVIFPVPPTTGTPGCESTPFTVKALLQQQKTLSVVGFCRWQCLAKDPEARSHWP